MSQNKHSVIITLKNPLRSSYMHVNRPNPQDREGRFTTSILIPKSDQQTVTQIMDAYNEVAKVAFGGGTRGNGPLHDGDLPKYQDPKYEGAYNNCWHINAKQTADIPVGKVKTDVTGQNVVVNDPNEQNTLFYSGGMYYFQISLYAYFEQGGGIGYGLKNIMFAEHAPRLGGAGNEDPLNTFQGFKSGSTTPPPEMGGGMPNQGNGQFGQQRSNQMAPTANPAHQYQQPNQFNPSQQPVNNSQQFAPQNGQQPHQGINFQNRPAAQGNNQFGQQPHQGHQFNQQPPINHGQLNNQFNPGQQHTMNQGQPNGQFNQGQQPQQTQNKPATELI